MRKSFVVMSVALVAMVGMMVTSVAAQPGNPRFGRWKLKSDAPAPQSNIMTYEPHGAKGMKITVESVNAKGEKSAWWYVTEFDGKDMPVTGQENAMTSVRTIDDRINEIVNKRNGKVTQILTNVLSPDGDTIGVMYMRMDPEGKRVTNITFATYERIK